MSLWTRIGGFFGWTAKKKRLPRERFLLPKEWDRMRPILHTKPDKVRVYFSVVLLELCRMSELRTAKWDHLDLDAKVWHKSTTKNGKRKLHPLSDPAVELLRTLPQEGPYVFPGASASVPWSRTAVRYAWRKIRWEAGCPDVQIRDLRRTGATWMVQNGVNLMTIKELLDHAFISTTQVYARSDTATQALALNQHAKQVMNRHSDLTARPHAAQTIPMAETATAASVIST